MPTLASHPSLERYLATCTYCGTSAALRPVTGDEIPLFLNAHCHPHCGPVIVTVRLIRRLAAAA